MKYLYSHNSITFCHRDLGQLGHCTKFCVKYFCGMSASGSFFAIISSVAVIDHLVAIIFNHLPTDKNVQNIFQPHGFQS